MQIIHYSGDTYLTGDDIAFAVVEYAKTLALAESSATVGIPFRRDDTSTGHLELLIGPASQIVLESSPTSGHELQDEELVASLNQKTMLAQVTDDGAIDVEDQADARLTVPEDY
jgi:hypothetical protein